MKLLFFVDNDSKKSIIIDFLELLSTVKMTTTKSLAISAKPLYLLQLETEKGVQSYDI